MIIYESWLRAWIKTELTIQQIANRLTLSGLEVERIWKCENDQDEVAIEISITPNRGDCLSVFGIARELSILLGISLNNLPEVVHIDSISQRFTVSVTDSDYCGAYSGAVVLSLDVTQPTPVFIREVLKANGTDCINIIVDITNYVMLMFGQPMHAFDLDCISGSQIDVRSAREGESILLLNGVEKVLTEEHTVIADEQKILALPGMMGGDSSKVTDQTHAIFLESASFTPVKVALMRQAMNLHTDGAHRFERGVDPLLHAMALDYTIALLLKYAQGTCEGLIHSAPRGSFAPVVISLSFLNVEKYLGVSLTSDTIQQLLQRFCSVLAVDESNITVQIPTHRFDLNMEVDLIEELARLIGYESIPAVAPTWIMQPMKKNHFMQCISDCKNSLTALGYQETVTYSFISKTDAMRFSPKQSLFFEIANPISTDMAIMRGSLLPGLVSALLYNQARQRNDIKFFELARVFSPSVVNDIRDWKETQPFHLAGLISGHRVTEQLAQTSPLIDFFDIKGDLEYVLQQLNVSLDAIIWKIFDEDDPMSTFLHPFQHASLFYKDNYIGYVGQLHPALLQEKDILGPVFVFELLVEPFIGKEVVSYQSLSSFPEIRRDLSLIVPIDVTYDRIRNKIKQMNIFCLKDFYLFDVYQGKGVPEQHQSLALRFIFQSMDRTLKDEEVVERLGSLIASFEKDFNAKLR